MFWINNLILFYNTYIIMPSYIAFLLKYFNYPSNVSKIYILNKY